ncbi:sodium:solute symporter family protein [Crateriforma conspicua]|uniref:Putative transporter n=1 Tax=Crateriforma conspicua TaxID=2527996 RepID=A0A5C5Y028_9PLAN|nr:hypothetical protein [Crateriforma conspicua]TWT69017.1 putative transporter [Crateriforma conspicua]
MHLFDWIIVVSVMVSALAIAVYARRLVRSVSGYLVAERSAGRYLLVVSNGMAGLGAITIVAQFELFYDAGLTANWWMLLSIPATLVIALSGWVYYRFRQTRAMTLGEFLGQRYSQRFRVFAGVLAFVSGVLNFGIFPAVGSRFVMTLADLPESIWIGVDFPLQPILMVSMVGAATCIVLLGGQVVIILTDLLFGFVTMLSMFCVISYLWWWMDWAVLVDVFESDPVGHSRLDPFSSARLAGFNIWYFAIGILFSFYATMTFQGDTPYRAAPISPHESKMAAVLVEWRALSVRLMMMLVPLAAIILLEGGGNETLKQAVESKIASIDNPVVARQMTVPAAASVLLPVGLKGAFIVLVLGAFLSTHDTYLHAWASVFIRDVVQPLRSEPLSDKGEIRLLRFGVVTVAAMILAISLLIQPSDYLLKFMFLSASIFIGGAGAVLIGGLYTNWGNTWGAWASLSVGAAVATVGVIGQTFWIDRIYPWLSDSHPNWLEPLQKVLDAMTLGLPGIEFPVGDQQFPIDGQWWSLGTMVLATASYILGSVVQGLFMGWPTGDVTRFFVDGVNDVQRESGKVRRMLRSLFPSEEFTLGDKWIWGAKMAWTGGLGIVFVVGTTAACFFQVDGRWWATFWNGYIQATLVIALVTTCWFSVGAVGDLKRFLVRLAQNISDADD